MGNIFTYPRISTLDQNTDLQVKALKAAHPDGVHQEETKSATTIKGRFVLNTLMDMIRPDDKLVVWKLDRLARNMKDLTDIIETLNRKGAVLEILDQKVDTSRATGRAFLQMFGAFAEFDTNLSKERQLAWIAAAKAKGKQLCRKASLTNEQKQDIRTKNKAGMKPSQLSQEYVGSRGTIYNVLKR